MDKFEKQLKDKLQADAQQCDTDIVDKVYLSHRQQLADAPYDDRGSLLPIRRTRRLSHALICSALALILVFAAMLPLLTRPAFDVRPVKSLANLNNYISRSVKNVDLNANLEFSPLADQSNVLLGTPRHSTTNTQVESIDEADIVKTDGYHIFTLNDRSLVVTDPVTMTIVTKFEMPNTFFNAFYLLSDSGGKAERVVLLSGVHNNAPSLYSNFMLDCLYVPSAAFGIVILDISDIAMPQVTYQASFDNFYFNTSRVYNGVLYLTAHSYNVYDIAARTAVIPSYKTTINGTTQNYLLGFDDIYLTGVTDFLSYFATVTVDLSTVGNYSIDFKTYLGSIRQVYMSTANLYATMSNCHNDKTVVMRFALSGGKLEYKAAAQIDGNPLNQFSMDEHDGVLRIATTQNWPRKNTLYMLDATSDGKLNRIATLGGLGKPDESIYAVRFYGDVGYVVTFKQIDPLYVLDLSDAHNPKIAGELEIPGVSHYLHRFNDDLLLGIGTIDQNLKISMFNVNGAPYETSGYTFNSEFSHSDATYNHKALLFYTDPITEKTYFGFSVYETNSNIAPNSNYWFFQCYYLFEIGDNGDISLVKRVVCDINSTVCDSAKRGLFIDDSFYVVTNFYLLKYDIESFELVSKLELSVPFV